jgi:hypothetical protein
VAHALDAAGEERAPGACGGEPGGQHDGFQTRPALPVDGHGRHVDRQARREGGEARHETSPEMRAGHPEDHGVVEARQTRTGRR